MTSSFRSLCAKFPVVVTILLMALGLLGGAIAIHNLLVGVLIVAGVVWLSMIALGGMQYT